MKSKTDSNSDSELRKIYEMKNIAVVGMSAKGEKAGHFVPLYLIEHGYNVIPVNPTLNEIQGRRSYPDLSSVPYEIDIVDIFRRSEDIPNVIEDAIRKKGVKVIWMQEGIYNEEAERKAKDSGMNVVFNRCMMAEHRRLFR
jgi:predicted CoA-binding protein